MTFHGQVNLAVGSEFRSQHTACATCTTMEPNTQVNMSVNRLCKAELGTAQRQPHLQNGLKGKPKPMTGEIRLSSDQTQAH